MQQDALLAIFQQMHGNNHAATVADVAAADLLVDQAGSALPAEQLLLAVPQAYQQQDFAEMNFPVFQVPMRGPSISQAFLRAARRICYESMGFNTHTCPSAAPPAPAEVLEVFEQLRRLSGSLLDGLELVTIICNKQDDDPKAKGKAHKDPADYGGIVGINLGPGTATMDLLEPRVGKHEVAYTQVLALGTAYILVGDSVKYYNHIISAPTGGVRACVPACLPADLLARRVDGVVGNVDSRFW